MQTDCIYLEMMDLAVRGLEVYIHGTEERLLQAARGDRVDGVVAASILKKVKKEETAKLGRETFTWSVIETILRSKE